MQDDIPAGIFVLQYSKYPNGDILYLHDLQIQKKTEAQKNSNIKMSHYKETHAAHFEFSSN